MTVREHFERLLEDVLTACLGVYGDRLVSLVVFGSVGRGAPRSDSDVDLLLVVDPLPDGRIPRVAEFEAVEERLRPRLSGLSAGGIHTRFSPVFKTPCEAGKGSPLFLDMLEDGRILLDRGGVFVGVLERLRKRLAELGARRIWRGNAWYWDLKPDYKPGEVFEIFP